MNSLSHSGDISSGLFLISELLKDSVVRKNQGGNDVILFTILTSQVL